MDLTEAVVIGTGTMGPGIAASLALAGVRTSLVSRTANGAMRGVFLAQGLIQQLKENGLATAKAADGAVERIFGSDNASEPAARAGLVVEAVIEDMEVKRGVFRELDAVAPPQAILASDTSGLSITAIAEATKRPERVITTHFWNPPHLMQLVEVVVGEKTDPGVADRTMQIMRAIGKIPVLVRKDRPGQLGNRIQSALMREAMHIVQEGIASVEDVDRVVRLGFGLRMPMWGPLQHMDAVGLDLVLAIQDYVLPDLNNEPCAPQILRDKVARGELGQKSGKGFYERDLKPEIEARDRFLIEFLRARTQRGN